jgi:hypothetical protein
VIVGVDSDGLATAGPLPSEVAVSARFENIFASCEVTIPLPGKVTDEYYRKLPRYNEVDELVYGRLQKLGITVSGPCDDSTFMRRAYLDVIGRLPTAEEARLFLADTCTEKRENLVDALLDRPEYADHWAMKWIDLLRPNPYRVGIKAVINLDAWIRDQFRQNRPYDAFVNDILTASGSTFDVSPATFFRDRREPEEITPVVSQLFLGIRLDCAKCHHHPSEKWAQEDYYQLASFFGKMRSRGQGISAPISGEAELWWYDAKGRGVVHPITEALLVPKMPDGPEVPYVDGVDPRQQLVDWMVNPQNPFFARAIVNRIWSEFMGRGFVEPVDDFRVSNPPTNPELLDWLAADFVAHGFDLKHLMRRILNSAAYQRSSLPNEMNETDQRNFSHALRRRLPAEVLLDAVGDLTGGKDGFAGLPPGSRAMDTWNHKIPSEFLDAFGRPNASQECPCERDRKPTIVQSLHLMNSSALQAKLINQQGRVAIWSASNRAVEDLIKEIYLSAFSREPDSQEVELASRYLGNADASRSEGVQDLVWALINTAEFVFNH